MILFQEKIHYENIMKNKVLPDIKDAEANYEELKNKRKVQIISNYDALLVLQTKRNFSKCKMHSFLYNTPTHRYINMSLLISWSLL